MKALRSSKPQATHILDRLLATPDLVSSIQALPLERLGALVHTIGLEDASEVVSLATIEQLVDLFDDDLWISGDDVSERFDAERVLLDVAFRLGWSVVVERGDEPAANMLRQLSRLPETEDEPT